MQHRLRSRPSQGKIQPKRKDPVCIRGLANRSSNCSVEFCRCRSPVSVVLLLCGGCRRGCVVCVVVCGVEEAWCTGIMLSQDSVIPSVRASPQPMALLSPRCPSREDLELLRPIGVMSTLSITIKWLLCWWSVGCRLGWCCAWVVVWLWCCWRVVESCVVCVQKGVDQFGVVL